jgi:dTDP-4-dehydrorhamnose 3,5-epimerase
LSADRWQPMTIDGVMRGHSTAVADERGAFREVWRASQTSRLGGSFAQANLSQSRAGVLRGMHFHRRQVDLWFVVEGRALAAMTDLRGLASGGTVNSDVIEMAPGDMLLLPRLVAHGFWAVEETRLLYLVTNEYDGTDEHGFAWNDPAAAIPWPVGSPILSDRDQSNPSLSAVAEMLRAGE